MSARTTVGVWIPDRPALTLAAETHLIEKPAARARVASHEATAWVRQSALATQIHAWHPDVVHIVFGEGYPTSARAAAALAARGSRSRRRGTTPSLTVSSSTASNTPSRHARCAPRRGFMCIVRRWRQNESQRSCSSPSCRHSRARPARASRRRNRCVPKARSPWSVGSRRTRASTRCATRSPSTGAAGGYADSWSSDRDACPRPSAGCMSSGRHSCRSRTRTSPVSDCTMSSRMPRSV